MKKKTKRLFGCLILIFLFIDVSAQEYQVKHEISITGGGGISTLNYNLNQGNYTFGIGGNAGLDYTYFLNENLGIRSGVEISYYNAKATIESFSDNYMTNDGKDDFEFRFEISDYKEKQHLMLVNIPLMLQFQHQVFCCNGHLFYLALGGKMGLPIRASYKTSDATCTTSAYYEQYDLVLDAPSFQGFGTFTGGKAEKKLNFKTSWMLSAETGIKWMLSESFSLYSGIYCDYGLNDISKRHNQRFLIYNPNNPSVFQTNSILNAQYIQKGKTDNYTGKVIPVSIGLKFRFTFRVPD